MIYNIGPRSMALALYELVRSGEQTEQVKRRLLSIVLDGIAERTSQLDGDAIRQHLEGMWGSEIKW